MARATDYPGVDAESAGLTSSRPNLGLATAVNADEEIGSDSPHIYASGPDEMYPITAVCRRGISFGQSTVVPRRGAHRHWTCGSSGAG